MRRGPSGPSWSRTASNGGDIRPLMDKALWARFGETVVTAPHAIQWLSDNGPQYTATARCSMRMSSA
jgi:transposase InsO family protein